MRHSLQQRHGAAFSVDGAPCFPFRSSARTPILAPRLVTLLQRVPLSLVDRGRLLPLAENSRFFRAAVILLKAVSSYPFRGTYFAWYAYSDVTMQHCRVGVVFLSVPIFSCRCCGGDSRFVRMAFVLMISASGYFSGCSLKRMKNEIWGEVLSRRGCVIIKSSSPQRRERSLT